MQPRITGQETEVEHKQILQIQLKESGSKPLKMTSLEHQTKQYPRWGSTNSSIWGRGKIFIAFQKANRIQASVFWGKVIPEDMSLQKACFLMLTEDTTSLRGFGACPSARFSGTRNHQGSVSGLASKLASCHVKV